MNTHATLKIAVPIADGLLCMHFGHCAQFAILTVDAAAKAIEENGGGIVKGPYDDAHERRAVVYDNKGNGLVFYKPLAR